MCRHEATRYACGCLLPKMAIGTDTPAISKCTPVLFALKFYHDQMCYIACEKTHEENIKVPKPCPAVYPRAGGVTPFIKGKQTWWNTWLHNRMLAHRLGPAEVAQIQQYAGLRDLESRREELRVETYPANMFLFTKDLQTYQDRPFKAPNVTISNVEWGCGRPGPNPKCLAEWTGAEILMCRMRDWNVGPKVAWLTVDWSYLVHTPLKKGEYTAPRETIITVPVSARLMAVLDKLGPGRLVHPRSSTHVALPTGLMTLHDIPPPVAAQQATGQRAVDQVDLHSQSRPEYPATPDFLELGDTPTRGSAPGDNSHRVRQAVGSVPEGVGNLSRLERLLADIRDDRPVTGQASQLAQAAIPMISTPVAEEATHASTGLPFLTPLLGRAASTEDLFSVDQSAIGRSQSTTDLRDTGMDWV